MNLQLDLEPFTFEGVSKERPLVIAGPCSAESEKQMIETAKALKAAGIGLFRAGIWKPRTRPNSFEGLGSKALPWMKKVKEETGMLTATEVANVKHVYEALKYGVDIIWIGARTTTNPFAVQEIADTLKGVDIPVMVKNPVNPDLELWIGAIERIYNAGIRKIAAIHRGFSIYDKSDYRNEPHWQIPIDLKRRLPNVPMITDPSHICGNRTRLYEVSQQAMDVNFDGLIIETHPDPDHALSDASQQITPDALACLLKRIVIRRAEAVNGELRSLEQMRAEIDKIDELLIQYFGKRMQISEQIGQYKKDHGIAVYQNSRWDQLMKKRIESGLKSGLSNDFVDEIFKRIHEESINRQSAIMNKEN